MFPLMFWMQKSNYTDALCLETNKTRYRTASFLLSSTRLKGNAVYVRT